MGWKQDNNKLKLKLTSSFAPVKITIAIKGLYYLNHFFLMDTSDKLCIHLGQLDTQAYSVTHFALFDTFTYHFEKCIHTQKYGKMQYSVSTLMVYSEQSKS